MTPLYRTFGFIILAVLFLFPAGAATGAVQKRLTVESVSFTGNHVFSDKRLRSIMLTRPSTIFRQGRFYEDVLKDDLKGIELFYRQQGYLNARIDNWTAHVDSTRNRVAISIALTEGIRTIVEGVGVLGNDFFDDTALMGHITLHAGETLLRARIEESTLGLLHLYADNGFLDFEVTPDIRINDDIGRALVDFVITERSRYKISNILISGLDKTRRSVVARELKFRPGEVVTYSRLLESQRIVYMTGLFKSVFIRPQPSADGDSTKKDILVDVKENLNSEYNVSAGYGSVERIRGKMELYTNNLWGTARKLGITGTLSSINRNAEVSFSEPWTFGVPWRTDLSMKAEYREEPGYRFKRNGGKVTTGRSISPHVNANISYRQETSRLSHVKVSEIPENLKSNTRSFMISLIYDSRDNLFNPSRGFYTDMTGELGRFFSEKTSDFVRITCGFKYYRAIIGGALAATSLETGWIDNSHGFDAIPLHERFYTGGPQSVRGFEYQKAGPLDDNGYPTGGKIKLSWNVFELRKPIYRVLSGVIFMDAGTVWSTARSLHLANIRTSAGAGLRINTPVGLARLDYARNLEPRRDERHYMLHFSMGQAF